MVLRVDQSLVVLFKQIITMALMHSNFLVKSEPGDGYFTYNTLENLRDNWIIRVLFWLFSLNLVNHGFHGDWGQSN